MRQILVYGDSLSWGIIPLTRQRLEFDQRWPGVMENRLNAVERRYRVIEDCLNGRRTVLDDPSKPGRNGHAGLAQRIEMHSPLALVVLMLGTNDFQSMHDYQAADSAQGIAKLVMEIRNAPMEPGMPTPPILIMAPPPIGIPKGQMAEKFAGSGNKCVGFSAAYREIASTLGCHFFDAASVTLASPVEGVHLDADQHMMLGKALADVVTGLLP